MAKTVKKTKKAIKPAAKKTAKKLTKKTTKKASPKKAAKKTTVKKTKKTVKKTSSKKLVKKTTKKVASKKLSKTRNEVRSAKLALRRKKIQEIKNNYDGPVASNKDDENEYRQPIIGRTRFSDMELKEFKDIINKKLEGAREELRFYQDQMKESEMNDDDIKFSGMEDGGHTNDKEHLSAMANRQTKFIQNLENALIRIENKTYGICRMTGKLIDKKRLKAVPHATLSMEAKTKGKNRK